MTPTELIQNAHNVESQGIPVDWKGLCMKVFESANQQIVALEKQVEDYKAAADEEEELSDGGPE